MCFSPEADLVGGLIVTGAGADAVRHARTRPEIGLAALPLAFGAHQIIEAFAWWGLDGIVPPDVGDAAAWAYVLIAFLLPAAVPPIVRAVEPDPGRKRVMWWLGLIGAAVAAALVLQLADGPLQVTDAGRYLDYDAGLVYGGQLAVLYVAATCGPTLLSSIPRVRWFGAVNLVIVLGLARLQAAGVISLWCAWAAVASILIVLHLRTGERQTTESPAERQLREA